MTLILTLELNVLVVALLRTAYAELTIIGS
jgi:hypothetical protein